MDSKNISSLIMSFIGSHEQIEYIDVLCSGCVVDGDLRLLCLDDQEKLSWMYRNGYVMHETITKETYPKYRERLNSRIWRTEALLFLRNLQLLPYINRPPPAVYVELRTF